MAYTSTPESPGTGQRPAGAGSRPEPRSSTIAIIRQIARLYPARPSVPFGMFIAN